MMNDQEIQKHLLYITKLHAKDISLPKFKGVTALWKNNIAFLTFYFKNEPTLNEIEDVSIVATEIAAHMPQGELDEKYVVLNRDEALPQEGLAFYK